MSFELLKGISLFFDGDSVMAVRERYTSLNFLLLMAAATLGQSESHVVSEAMYLKLHTECITH